MGAITGTDISNRTVRVFSLESTPDMEVALAVRISMSIPLFFTAAKGIFVEKRNWDMLLHQLQTRFGWKKTEY